MKIIMVFSSPSSATSEYRNLWCCCPQKREIDTGQLVIDGNGWKVLVYDGLNKKYWDLEWNISMFEREVMAIKKQYEDSSMAILLHGYETEINMLKQRLTSSLNSKIMDVCYSSEKGTFYEEDLKSFSNNASDQNFEILWKVIEEIQSEDTGYDLSGEIGFLEHKFHSMSDYMNHKIDKARDDVSNLLEFKDFVYEVKELQGRYEKIRPDLIKFEILNNRQVGDLMEEVAGEICEIGKGGVSHEAALQRAYSCLNKTNAIHDIFQEMWEVNNG